MSQKENNILLITGSSRPQGNTYTVMDYLSRELKADLLNLNDFQISYYDYNHLNKEDDFLAVAEKMTESDIIILGSPVYWYSFSAQMKTFIDRWSDLLTIRKDLGRKLNGKHLVLVSCGSWEESGKGFENPIEQTAMYMNMHFSGYFHTWLTDDEDFNDVAVQNRLQRLQDNLRKVLSLSLIHI